MDENKVCGAAIIVNHAKNVRLLFGSKGALAIHVAVVSSMSAKKSFDFIAQGHIVFALHFAEKCVKSPRNTYHALLKIMLAGIAFQCIRVDSRATCEARWCLFAHEITHAGCFQDAILVRAQDTMAWHRPKIEYGVSHNEIEK